MHRQTRTLTGLALAAILWASTGCNSITANYYDPTQEATLFAGTQRILTPHPGQMETVGNLPDVVDLPFTLVADTVLIPLNLVYILSGYEPNVKRGEEPVPTP